MSKRPLKVRFHLGRGRYYMMWQIRHGDDVEYVDPNGDECIYMHNAVLHNRRSVAEVIHSGSNKAVCAWVSCSSIIISGPKLAGSRRISRVMYDPKVAPYWRQVVDGVEENVDSKNYKFLSTLGSRLYETI